MKIEIGQKYKYLTGFIVEVIKVNNSSVTYKYNDLHYTKSKNDFILDFTLVDQKCTCNASKNNPSNLSDFSLEALKTEIKEREAVEKDKLRELRDIADKIGQEIVAIHSHYRNLVNGYVSNWPNIEDDTNIDLDTLKKVVEILKKE